MVSSEDVGYLCAEGKMIVKLIIRIENSVNIDISVMGGDNTIYSGSVATNITAIFCLEKGTYTLTENLRSLEDKSTLDVLVKIEVDGVNIIYERPPAGREVVIKFLVDSYIGLGTIWRYYDQPQTTNLWATPTNYKALPALSPPLPNRPLKTRYYVTKFTVKGDLSSVSAVSINIRYDAGLILFLNGVEVFRKNLPKGSVDYSTPASAFEGTTDYQWITFTGANVRYGINYLGAEIHTHAASKEADPLSIKNLLFISGNRQCTRYYEEVVGETFEIRTNRECYWDELCYRWVDLGYWRKGYTYPANPLYIQIFNKKKEYHVYNHMAYSIANGPYRVLKSYKFNGVDVDTNEHVLISEVSETFVFQQYALKYKYFDNDTVFHGYAYLDIGTSGNDGIEAYDLTSGTCSYYCMADEMWPTTKFGETARINCPASSTRQMTRVCNGRIDEGGQWGESDTSNCGKIQLKIVSLKYCEDKEYGITEVGEYTTLRCADGGSKTVQCLPSLFYTQPSLTNCGNFKKYENSRTLPEVLQIRH